MEMKHKQVALTGAKMIDEGNGGFAGYVSTFGNVDRGGEQVVKGAFLDSIESFKRDGWLAIGHDWFKMGPGFVVDAQEDDHGLWVEFAFHGDAESQAIRQKVKERLAAGKTVSMSIGYFIKAEHMKRQGDVLLLTKIDLQEVSLVNVPMNPAALVAGAKGGTLTMAQHDEMMKSLLADYLKRFEDREQFRAGDTKESRELSSSNVKQLDEWHDTLIDMAAKMKDMADRNRKGIASGSDAKGATDDPAAVTAQWNAERLKTERLRTEYLTTSIGVH